MKRENISQEKQPAILIWPRFYFTAYIRSTPHACGFLIIRSITLWASKHAVLSISHGLQVSFSFHRCIFCTFIVVKQQGCIGRRRSWKSVDHCLLQCPIKEIDFYQSGLVFSQRKACRAYLSKNKFNWQRDHHPMRGEHVMPPMRLVCACAHKKTMRRVLSSGKFISPNNANFSPGDEQNNSVKSRVPGTIN